MSPKDKSWKSRFLAVGLVVPFLVAGAAGGFVGKEYGRKQLKPVISALQQQNQDLMEENRFFRKRVTEKIHGPAEDHPQTLVQHLLLELHSHPPADEEIERILMAYSAEAHKQAFANYLDVCCRDEFEKIKQENETYKQNRNVELRERIVSGILWLKSRCSMKIEVAVSTGK